MRSGSCQLSHHFRFLGATESQLRFDCKKYDTPTVHLFLNWAVRQSLEFEGSPDFPPHHWYLLELKKAWDFGKYIKAEGFQNAIVNNIVHNRRSWHHNTEFGLSELWVRAKDASPVRVLAMDLFLCSTAGIPTLINNDIADCANEARLEFENAMEVRLAEVLDADFGEQSICTKYHVHKHTKRCFPFTESPAE